MKMGFIIVEHHPIKFLLAGFVVGVKLLGFNNISISV
jgi:hypothetical protein